MLRQIPSEVPMRPFHAYLRSTGSMTTGNPELVRISKRTGYSPDHLYRVALGHRPASSRCAKAVCQAIGRRDPGVTEASLQG